MRYSKFLVLIVLIVVIVSLILIKTLFKFGEVSIKNNYLVTGESNPGRISLYKKETNGFVKQSIDTGFLYVYTVRVGDAHHDGINRIYAGVGNSFFASPSGCQVLAFDPTNKFQKEIIDDVGDLRCKDLTIGDVNNDGKTDLVVGTHGEGIIKFYTKTQNGWRKELINKNLIAEYDTENNTNHRVSESLLPYPMVLQTAVHILAIGDADNDGLNELVATISDPLEYPEEDHRALWTLFKYENNTWKKTIVDSYSEPIPFKATVKINDITNDGKNEIVIGTSHHKLITYSLKNDTWEKNIIEQEESSDEDNMKGVDIVSLSENDPKTIFVGTGINTSKIYQFNYMNDSFTKKEIASISKELIPYKLSGSTSDNILDIKVVDFGDSVKHIAVGGIQNTNLSLANENDPKIGWEGTNVGFTFLVSPREDGSYKTTLLDTRSVISLDGGQLEVK